MKWPRYSVLSLHVKKYRCLSEKVSASVASEVAKSGPVALWVKKEICGPHTYSYKSFRSYLRGAVRGSPDQMAPGGIGISCGGKYFPKEDDKIVYKKNYKSNLKKW